MEYFRYWAHADLHARDATGRPLALRKWAGSNSSADEARESAQQAVTALAQKLAGLRVKKYGRGHEQYLYGMGTRPEELIGEATPDHAIIRNRYGCQVLNAAGAMFVDIDLPRQGALSKWLRGDLQKKQRGQLEAWLSQHSGAGVRIYRTAAGFRYLLAHRSLPVSAETLQWQQDMGADKLYIQLCKTQCCYRARLTPKPWRMKMERPPNFFPRTLPQQEEAFARWLRDYEQKSNGYATCRLLETLGAKAIHYELEDMVRTHDDITRASRDLPLA